MCRTVALFNDTGTVDKRKHPPNSGTAVLTDIDKLIIIETISERPDIYLREITEVLVNETGTHVDVSTIWRFLHSSNITRQKMVLKPPVSKKLLVRGQRVNAIAAISTSGVLDCHSVTSSVDGDRFIYFVQNILLPHLQPFDGVNPHSVVVMDNASIHHVHGVAPLIESTGALLYYLPPYCPDLNPIEEAFSKLNPLTVGFLITVK